MSSKTFNFIKEIFEAIRRQDKILLHGSKMCGSIIVAKGERSIMASEEYKLRKAAYVKRYQKENYTNISFKVRTERDRDILETLANVPNKSAFIIGLIRNHNSNSKKRAVRAAKKAAQ